MGVDTRLRPPTLVDLQDKIVKQFATSIRRTIELKLRVELGLAWSQ